MNTGLSRSRDKGAASPRSTTSQTDDGDGTLTYGELQAWSNRIPQAVAQCSVMDACTMPSVCYKGDLGAGGKRDIFMLDKYPCRWVEMVGWVAGVVNKEEFVVLTLDDGDGVYTVEINVRLLIQGASSSTVNQPPAQEQPPLDYFPNSRRRANNPVAPKIEQPVAHSSVKRYQPLGICVGDHVRITGYIDEYTRRNGEGVRTITCDLREAGTLQKVNFEAQLQHARIVAKRHRELYSLPFSIPSAAVNRFPPPSAPVEPTLFSDDSTMTSSLGQSDVFESQSPGDVPGLRAPERLHRRLLTDETFRRYLADYMTSSTLAALNEAGPSSHTLLASWIPEYADAAKIIDKQRISIPLAEVDSNQDLLATPTPSRVLKPSEGFRLSASASSPPFAISHLAHVPQLRTLAKLVVKADAERRVKQNIRSDPVLMAKTSQASAQRKKMRTDAELLANDVKKRSRRLLLWALRHMAEEGTIVQVQLGRRCRTHRRHHSPDGDASSEEDANEPPETEAYLPLPPPLITSVLIHILEKEQKYRSSFFIKPSDPRKSNGLPIADLLSRLKSWGDEGRWERIPEWVVEDGIEDLDRAGKIRKWGSGWWPVGGPE